MRSVTGIICLTELNKVLANARLFCACYCVCVHMHIHAHTYVCAHAFEHAHTNPVNRVHLWNFFLLVLRLHEGKYSIFHLVTSFYPPFWKIKLMLSVL